MTLERLLSEHRRFVVALLGGLLVFVIGFVVIRSIEASTIKLERANARRAGNIKGLIADVQGREGFEQGLEQALMRRIGPEVRGTVEFAVRDTYKIPEGQNPFLTYHQGLKQIDEARESALRKGIKVPEAFGLTREPAEDRVGEQLAQLDVIERIVRAAEKLGLAQIVSLKPGPIAYVPIGAAEGADPAPAGSSRPTFLRRLPVEVTVIGGMDAAQLFLAGFDRPGQVLELASFTVAKEGENGEQVKLAAEFAGLALVTADQVPATGRPRSGSRGDRPSSSRRTSRRASR